MIGPGSVEGSVALIVAGMHRSGTSALTAALARIGFALGKELLPPSHDNVRGFWENRRFVDLHERLLAELGINWDDPRPMPEGWQSTESCARIRDELKVGVGLEFSGEPRWVFKDPRVCRLLPIWRSTLASLKVRQTYILAVRHPLEVASSLQARNGWGISFGELLWLRYVFDAIANTAEAARTVAIYDELLEDPRKQLCRMLEDLSIALPSAIQGLGIEEFFAREDKHHIAEQIAAPKSIFSALAVETYAALKDISTRKAGWETLSCYASEFERLWKTHAVALEDVMSHLHETRIRETNAHLEIRRLNRESDAEATVVAGIVGRLECAEENILRREQVADAQAEALARVVVGYESALSELTVLRDQAESSAVLVSNVLPEMQRNFAGIKQEIGSIHVEAARLQQGIEVLVREGVEKEAENRRLLDGLQAQISLLKEANERLMRRGRFTRALFALPFVLLRLAKRVVKRAVKWFLLALPGDGPSKQARVDRVRNFYGVARSGVNGQAISSDIQMLAKDRWSDAPSYLPRTSSASIEPVVDISIVLYNSSVWLEGFFESVLELDYPRSNMRILLRDHSPHDGTRKEVDRLLGGNAAGFMDVVYSRGRNQGFGAGHNHNFSLSDADYFLVCNVDGRFPKQSFHEIFKAVENSKESIAAWEFRQTPYEHPKYYDPVTMKTTWVSGACVLFRSSSYRAVGGFDDAIFMYGEDVDLSYRLRARGFELVYVPRAVFHHDTYVEANAFKPIQFHGSTLANVLMRLRFGGLVDIAGIPWMWMELGRAAKQQGVYPGYLKNTLRLITKSFGFLLSRSRAHDLRIPFAKWDYGIRREGAFETIDTVAADRSLVSIIVRTYHGRFPLLRQALISIANQTYTNIEVLVVEDKGATLRDDVAVLSRELGLNIRYFGTEGLESNRCMTGNIGLHESRGQYCCFLDDDDLLYAEHVEYLVSKHLESPEMEACYSLAWETKIEPDKMSPAQYVEVVHSTLPEMRREFDYALMQQYNYIPIQAVLFKRELYLLHGGFNEALENLEDWELWRRYSRSGKFKFCPKTTSIYHIPYDLQKQAARQAVLDSYYPVAKTIGDEAQRLAGSDRTLRA
jgi:GT2 family glycosyltransferase